MNTTANPLNFFLEDFYNGDIKGFREDLNNVIFYLHYVDSEVISSKQIQDVCFALKELVKACDDDHS